MTDPLRSLKTKAAQSRSKMLVDMLCDQLTDAGLSEPDREYRFHPKRRWRIDLAYPDHKLAIECEGGIYSRGAHVRGTHFISDLEKYNQLTILGWRLIRVTPDMIESSFDARDVILAAFGGGDA